MGTFLGTWLYMLTFQLSTKLSKIEPLLEQFFGHLLYLYFSLADESAKGGITLYHNRIRINPRVGRISHCLGKWSWRTIKLCTARSSTMYNSLIYAGLRSFRKKRSNFWHNKDIHLHAGGTWYACKGFAAPNMLAALDTLAKVSLHPTCWRHFIHVRRFCCTQHAGGTWYACKGFTATNKTTLLCLWCRVRIALLIGSPATRKFHANTFTKPGNGSTQGLHGQTGQRWTTPIPLLTKLSWHGKWSLYIQTQPMFSFWKCINIITSDMPGTHRINRIIRNNVEKWKSKYIAQK